MKNIAIIDLGSNSVRLILVKVGEKGNFKIINDIKESLRLQEDLGKNAKILDERIKKGVLTLQMFRQICDAAQVEEIIAVGTEALRQASNGQVFLDEVKKATGIEIRILSGEEEAYYDYLAVINSTELNKCLILDIGGGSSELIYVKDKQLQESISLPFGAITLSQMFLLYDEITIEKEKALEKYLLEAMKKIPWLQEAKGLNLVAIGGSLRNIAKVDRQIKDYPLDIVHHYEMNSKDAQDIYKLLKEVSLEERKKIKGLSKERADIIVGSAAWLAKLLMYSESKKIIFSGHGLREGLIYDYLIQRGLHIKDPVDYSIKNSILNYNLDEKHANQVYFLTRTLYKQLKALHGLNDKPKKLIKTAAMLHDMGVNIGYYKNYKHSFYMIVNSGINGLSHKELLISAYIAASKSKEGVKINLTRYSRLINKEDIEIVHQIGVLLKIAEGLDRNMSANIIDLQSTIEKERVIIKAIARDNITKEIIDLEIREAMKSAEQFKKIYNKDLTISP